MALSSIALCSRALIKIGANPISAFDEGTAEADVAANLYPSVRDALLSIHPWTFATGQMALPQLVAEPVADFIYAFQLPPDFLRALSVGDGGRGRGVTYRIAEQRIHANAATVTLTYVFRPGEATFPPFFDQALIARLAAEFTIPITESTSRSEALFRLAEKEIRNARMIDSQQETPAAIEDFTLVGVRS